MRIAGRGVRRCVDVAMIVFALAAILALYEAASADAYTHINLWLTQVSSTQAGGHPDIALHADYDTRAINRTGTEPGPCPECEDPRDIVTHMPTGFIGNPSQIPQCDLAHFALDECPPDTQVGVFMLEIFGGIYNGEPEPVALFSPIYNVPPHPYEAGLLGFIAPIVKFGGFISLNSRTESDYGLDGASFNTFRLVPPPALDIYLWGVPASAIHDKARFPLPVNPFCFGTPRDQTQAAGFPACHPPQSSSAPQVPFLDNPTSCNKPLSAGLDLTYYDNVFLHADTPWPSTTGCDQLSFSPSLSALPTTEEADTAAGVDFELKVPQSLSPTVPSPSEIKATRVTLPEGVSINANAADGKVACTDEQAAFGTRNEAVCPEAAKIGTDTLETTALPGPISGGIYLGQPLPGNRYRLFLTADGFATHVKLAGTIHPDPRTGKVLVTFEELPEAPFQKFDLHFFGSERGSLATPTQCGSYPVETEFEPWDSALPNQHSTSFFTIDSGPNGGPCPNGPRPFAPVVKAGVVDNTAGAHTSFGIKVTRPDGDQNLVSTTVRTPPGFLASLRGIPYCPDATLAALAQPDASGASELASPACPAASQIGTTIAGAGAGTKPLYTAGRVFLAGPYKGYPLSLVAVVPAVSGPYDVGNVVVRIAIHLDSANAQVTAISDPLPQIIDGIPLRLRSIQINLDRPDFIVNPTNCDPFSVDTTLGGNEGAQTLSSDHFQVANCANLGFSPKLGLRLTGGLRRRGHPAIHALLRSTPGESNIRDVQVSLPKGELVDNAHFGTVCTRPEFAAGACPAGSLIGDATVSTPLLDQPLKGSVYLRSSTHDLPDIAIELKGQVDFELVGVVESVSGALQTRFQSVPDAPVSSVALDLMGGSKGLIINSRTLCGKRKKARVLMTGQNGATVDTQAPLQASCGKASPRKRHKRAGKARG